MIFSISRSSTSLRAAALISPFSRLARASLSGAVRRMLPTTSARNGGFVLAAMAFLRKTVLLSPTSSRGRRSSTGKYPAAGRCPTMPAANVRDGGRSGCGRHTRRVGRRRGMPDAAPLRLLNLDGHLAVDHHHRVGLDRHHAGRRHHLAGADIELAVVEIALDHVVLD